MVYAGRFATIGRGLYDRINFAAKKAVVFLQDKDSDRITRHCASHKDDASVVGTANRIRSSTVGRNFNLYSIDCFHITVHVYFLTVRSGP